MEHSPSWIISQKYRALTLMHACPPPATNLQQQIVACILDVHAIRRAGRPWQDSLTLETSTAGSTDVRCTTHTGHACVCVTFMSIHLPACGTLCHTEWDYHAIKLGATHPHTHMQCLSLTIQYMLTSAHTCGGLAHRCGTQSAAILLQGPHIAWCKPQA
jgi:hypothetical protein